MEKQSFDLTLPVSALVGSITGAGIANKQMQNKILQQQQAIDNTVVLSGDYYSQVNNMSNNMKVTFTPFSVVYSLKNGPKWAQFETIPTESMNRDMYVAWQNRDSVYFKNLLLNKIKAEIQFAEQQYARNIINQHLELGKQASYDILPIELIGYVDNLRGAYKMEGMDKVASIMFSDIEDEVIKIAVAIENPSGFSDTIGGELDFMKINDNDKLDELQGKMLSPLYLKMHGKVAFLPDRVLFIVDNMVLTSMLAFDMDAESFDHFINKDQKYFEKLFDRETKMGLMRMKARLPEKKNLIKEASTIKIDISDIFNNTFVHPLIYYNVLSDVYTPEWTSFDIEPLVKMIEMKYKLEDGIGDIALNKILAIQSVNEARPTFENAHAFEKVIRSFAGLYVDWASQQATDIDPEDFAFGLECFDDVTPDIDTYDEFSEEVFSYMIKVLVKKDVKIFSPDLSTSRSKAHSEFYKVLNEFLLNAHEEAATEDVSDIKERADIIQREDLLHHAIINTLDVIRQNKIEVLDSSITKTLAEKQCPEDLLGLGLNQVKDAIRIDIYLSKQKDTLAGQLYMYGLSN